MSRPATGQVVERQGQQGTRFALRFRAYGKRRYTTLDVDTREAAEQQLRYVLSDVARGIWKAPKPEPIAAEPEEEPTFNEFASEWLASREQEGLGARTIEDYRWALVNHLIPYFHGHRLSEITIREVDRYKTYKAAEGVLSANTINKTLTRLSQILSVAVEYDLIAANPAAGKRRRLKGTRPRRAWVEPEQLMALLDAAAGNQAKQEVPLLGGRGRPLLATLAGAGLRIDEALSLQRKDVNIAKGTLDVGKAKTEAGVRTVDLTPALKDELALHLHDSPFKRPTDLVFPTSSGMKDNRQNIRQRLLHVAIKRANVILVEAGIDPIGNVTPHGLRRTFASLRCAAGDDPAYTASQLGHTDAMFTLRVYTHAVKRRERLSGAERKAFDRAIEWVRMGTNEDLTALVAEVGSTA